MLHIVTSAYLNFCLWSSTNQIMLLSIFFFSNKLMRYFEAFYTKNVCVYIYQGFKFKMKESSPIINKIRVHKGEDNTILVPYTTQNKILLS